MVIPCCGVNVRLRLGDWDARVGSDVSGRGIDDGAHLMDGVSGQAGKSGVLTYGVGIVGDVDAEDLVVGDEALLPLDAGRKGGKGLVRYRGRGAQLCG